MSLLARFLFLTALLGLFTSVTQAGPSASAFTYQGQLAENGTPAQGSHDFELALYGQAGGGAEMALNTFDDVVVSDGLFQLSADFTSAPFGTGQPLWVEVRVRPGAESGAFTPLLPRQAITASPYALVAQTVLAPLEVPGDASVQGDLQVNGEVRAGRVEADDIWSDGVVAFVNGASIGGALELGGEMNCTIAGGCVHKSALSFPVYSSQDDLVAASNELVLEPGQTGMVSATCPTGDLLVFGDCVGNPNSRLESLQHFLSGGLNTGMGVRCTFEQNGNITRTVTANAYCADAQ